MPQIELTNGEALMMIKNIIIKGNEKHRQGDGYDETADIYMRIVCDIEEVLEIVGYG